MGMFAALAAAIASSWSMVVLRKLNVRIVCRHRARVDAGDAAAVTSVQLLCLAGDFLRGTIVSAIALLAFVPLAKLVVPHWSIDAAYTRALVVTVAATVAASAVWKIFHTTARAGWLFILGLCAGGALLYVR